MKRIFFLDCGPQVNCVSTMNRQLGFTLVELMITLVIAAILLAIGVPSFQAMMRNNRAASQANEFTSALNLARTEAAKRGRNMVLCPSADQATCSGGTDWATGWLLFIDTNSNSVMDGVETVFRVWERLSGSPAFNGPATLGYRPTGEPVAGATQFSYVLDSHNQCIRINTVGRSHVEKEATSCP